MLKCRIVNIVRKRQGNERVVAEENPKYGSGKINKLNIYKGVGGGAFGSDIVLQTGRSRL
jgi:hypothetical protein